MLHLQPARVLGIYADVISKRLSPEAAEGARALNDMFRSKWADPNIQLQLDTVEEYLKDNDHFTGTEEIGLGDVSTLLDCLLTTDNDAFPHLGGVGRLPQGRVQHRTKHPTMGGRDASSTGSYPSNAAPKRGGGGSFGCQVVRVPLEEP